MTEPVVVADAGTQPSLAGRRTSRELAALDRSILHGIAWTTIAKWLVQMLAWANTILVVRLLTPADYGVAGMAAVFVAVLQPLTDFGIAAAVVQNRRLTRQELERLHGFAVLLGVGSTLLTVAAATPIARFFNEPALTKVVPIMGLGFLVGAIRVVPSAMLVREMRFRAVARVEAVEGLGVLVFTLWLALAGYGYWSLVLGTLLGRTVGATAALIARPLRMVVPPDIRSLAGSVRFGAWVAFSTLAWYVYTSADRLIVGRLVGEAALGVYTIAMTLAALPVEKISPLYLRVTEAVIAEVQSDSRAVARYLLRITEGVGFLTFPLSIGLALVADQFVPVVLGEQWREAIIPMQILAIASALRSLDPLLAQVLVATGHARANAGSMAIAAVILPIAFLFAAHWGMGLAGIAAVWLIGHPLIVLARQIWLALRVAEASVSEYIRALSPALVSTALMAAAVLGLRAILDDSIPAGVSLVVTTAIGLAAYSSSVLGLFPDRVRRAWKATQKIR